MGMTNIIDFSTFTTKSILHICALKRNWWKNVEITVFYSLIYTVKLKQKLMELTSIIQLTGACVLAGKVDHQQVETGFCSDLMSDVLTLDTDKMLLITGTANLQTIRTAEMADIHCILLVRNKKATKEMVKLAEESGITVLQTCMSSFRCCGILYQEGLKPVY
jgi:hypothetical protein